jgi:hypothetical protein
VYFELQAHEKGMAKMLLYENSKCQVLGDSWDTWGLEIGWK